MEVPYEHEHEREEDEVLGVDPKTRRRRSQSHHTEKIQSPTNSNSTLTSESSSDSSFEYFASMNNVNAIITNGEKQHQIIEGGSVIIDEDNSSKVEAQQEKSFEELNETETHINVAQNEDTNGFSVEQNGGDVVYSLPESNGGDKEMDTGTNASSFSESPDTAVGLKSVESLFDESSSSVSLTPPDTYNVKQNIVNKTLTISGQNDTVHIGHPEESEPEVAEFDVERVIQKQETHDFYCPNCNSCITKRVILRRRKRKIQEISMGDEAFGSKLGQTSPPPPARDGDLHDILEQSLENEPPQVSRAPDAAVDAITCFSCFRIFLPTGDGFLSWRFKPKPAVAVQPGTSTEPTEVIVSLAEEPMTDGTGNVFPLWILTCCQPYHAEKPVAKPGPRHTLTSEEGTGVPDDESELPPQLSHDAPVSPKPDPDTTLPPEPQHPVTLDEGKAFPMWIVTCCQPSGDINKSKHPEKPGIEVPHHEREPPVAPPDDAPVSPTPQLPTMSDPGTVPLPSKPIPSIEPDDDADSALPPEPQPPATHDSEKDFPLWIFNCCQPSADVKKPKHPAKPGIEVPSQGREFPRELSDDTPVPPTTQPPTVSEPGTVTLPSKPSPPIKPDDSPLPPEHQPHVTDEEGFPLWFLTCCQPSGDGKKPEPGKKPGTEVPSHESEIPLPPSYDVPAPPIAGDDADTLVPSKAEPPMIAEPKIPLAPKPILPKKPDDDVPSPPEPEPPATPPKGDVIVPIPKGTPKPQPPSIQPDTSEIGPSQDIEQPVLQRPHEPPRAGVSGVDIIKAIVYGGLLECITSLSVIASAAGGDATTLNIVALGLANVFGGLVVLLHNLRVLKHEHTTERYEDQLGRPGHFLLHAVVAIISYLVFGLMSPIIYGFSFRKSDNKDYKLATLAAASLVCITVLSIGKTYVRSPPKAYIQTIFYYLSLGFTVSGLGYVAGDLVNMFLKKLGVFDSRSSVDVPVLEAGTMKGAWSSF